MAKSAEPSFIVISSDDDSEDKLDVVVISSESDNETNARNWNHESTATYPTTNNKTRKRRTHKMRMKELVGREGITPANNVNSGDHYKEDMMRAIELSLKTANEHKNQFEKDLQLAMELSLKETALLMGDDSLCKQEKFRSSDAEFIIDPFGKIQRCTPPPMLEKIDDDIHIPDVDSANLFPLDANAPELIAQSRVYKFMPSSSHTLNNHCVTNSESKQTYTNRMAEGKSPVKGKRDLSTPRDMVTNLHMKVSYSPYSSSEKSCGVSKPLNTFGCRARVTSIEDEEYSSDELPETDKDKFIRGLERFSDLSGDSPEIVEIYNSSTKKHFNKLKREATQESMLDKSLLSNLQRTDVCLVCEFPACNHLKKPKLDFCCHQNQLKHDKENKLKSNTVNSGKPGIERISHCIDNDLNSNVKRKYDNKQPDLECKKKLKHTVRSIDLHSTGTVKIGERLSVQHCCSKVHHQKDKIVRKSSENENKIEKEKKQCPAKPSKTMNGQLEQHALFTPDQSRRIHTKPSKQHFQTGMQKSTNSMANHKKDKKSSTDHKLPHTTCKKPCKVYKHKRYEDVNSIRKQETLNHGMRNVEPALSYEGQFNVTVVKTTECNTSPNQVPHQKHECSKEKMQSKELKSVNTHKRAKGNINAQHGNLGMNNGLGVQNISGCHKGHAAKHCRSSAAQVKKDSDEEPRAHELKQPILNTLAQELLQSCKTKGKTAPNGEIKTLVTPNDFANSKDNKLNCSVLCESSKPAKIKEYCVDWMKQLKKGQPKLGNSYGLFKPTTDVNEQTDRHSPNDKSKALVLEKNEVNKPQSVNPIEEVCVVFDKELEHPSPKIQNKNISSVYSSKLFPSTNNNHPFVQNEEFSQKESIHLKAQSKNSSLSVSEQNQTRNDQSHDGSQPVKKQDKDNQKLNRDISTRKDVCLLSSKQSSSNMSLTKCVKPSEINRFPPQKTNFVGKCNLLSPPVIQHLDAAIGYNLSVPPEHMKVPEQEINEVFDDSLCSMTPMSYVPFALKHIHTIEACQEEEHHDSAVQLIHDFSTTSRIPSTNILNYLIKDVLLKSKGSVLTSRVYTTLLHILNLHPSSLDDIDWDWDFISGVVKIAKITVTKENSFTVYNHRLCLDYIISVLEVNLKRHVQDASIHKSMAANLLSPEMARSHVNNIISWILEVVKRESSGEYSTSEQTLFAELETSISKNLSTETVSNVPLKTLSPLLPLQKMLELCVVVSKNPPESTMNIAEEIMYPFLHLPSLHCRRQLFLTMSSSLIRAKLLEVLLDNCCVLDKTFDEIQSPGRMAALSIKKILQIHFKRLPFNNTFSESFNNDGSDIYKPEACEELVMMLYYLIQSHIQCVNGKLHLPTMSRYMTASQSSSHLCSPGHLVADDLHCLSDINAHVELLKKRLSHRCSEFTTMTNLLFQLMEVFKDIAA